MSFLAKVQKRYAVAAKNDDAAFKRLGGTEVIVKHSQGTSDALWVEKDTKEEHYDHGAKLATEYWGDDYTGTHWISNDAAYTLFNGDEK
jgi:hypothetical protein